MDSNKTFNVVRLINETPARSNSGPRGAIFLSAALPIKPLTLEVSLQGPAALIQVLQLVSLVD